MASFRFGTSLGSCSISSSGQRAQVAMEFDDTSNVDPRKLLQCPFDPNHQIQASRFPYHLIKCGKNHPHLSRVLKTCPFNARHLVQPHDFQHHLDTCLDRVRPVSPIMTRRTDAAAPGQMVDSWGMEKPHGVTPVSTEDWEAEADDSAAPFIWGRSSAKPTAIGTGNLLGQGVRPPNTLPCEDVPTQQVQFLGSPGSIL